MSIRHLPRIFLPEADMAEPVDLPSEEVEKLRKVLRLEQGDSIAILPNDGSVWECRFEKRQAVPVKQHWPATDAARRVIVAQALPKGDKLEEIIRACTEIGVAGFVLFAAERSVVQWDEKKRADRLRRYEVIAREASEVSFRTTLPTLKFLPNLAAVLKEHAEAVVLSEVEDAPLRSAADQSELCLAIGPEGGWSPRELALIGGRGVSLGPRVLRVDHAASAACAMLLLNNPFF